MTLQCSRSFWDLKVWDSGYCYEIYGVPLTLKYSKSFGSISPFVAVHFTYNQLVLDCSGLQFRTRRLLAEHTFVTLDFLAFNVNLGLFSVLFSKLALA